MITITKISIMIFQHIRFLVRDHRAPGWDFSLQAAVLPGNFHIDFDCWEDRQVAVLPGGDSEDVFHTSYHVLVLDDDTCIDIFNDFKHQDLGTNCSVICLWDKRHLLDFWHLLVGCCISKLLWLSLLSSSSSWSWSPSTSVSSVVYQIGLFSSGTMVLAGIATIAAFKWESLLFCRICGRNWFCSISRRNDHFYSWCPGKLVRYGMW